MAAVQRRRMGLAAAGAAAAAGVQMLGGPMGASAETSVPHGLLLQAPDGTLYLLVAGQAHPITPVPLPDEALTALPAGEPLTDGAFWLVPAAAWDVAPSPPARPNVAPFFATQTAVVPRGTGSLRGATATAQAVRQPPVSWSATRAAPTAPVRPLGQS